MKTNARLSFRVYELLLIAYPSEFRNEYGPLMAQLFRDRYRDEATKHKLAMLFYWCAVVNDLVVTAFKEHAQKRKGDGFMHNLRRDLIGLSACVAISVAAFVLLSYGRSHEVAPILLFGRILDAVATAGIVGNIVVFLLAKVTKWNPLRIALWTFLIVNLVPAIVLALVGPKIDPQFRLAATLISYVVSFLFWFSLHYAWRSADRDAVAES
jgi:hypothetical protein